ncbi:flagellar hook-basal body protein [Phycisphaerales bacterium AB-hyl4]|uniref:Flagellar hook-basal body protein n=1 Tax=Natronomicrosphaera hydrolytica TaxID=3242702 RepID=A0ABV4U7N7_9BACT
MNYGLYLSASGVLTNMYRQDVFANNLANAQTAAFKPDMPSIRQRDPQAVENQFGGDVSQRLLEKLGGGTLVGPQRIDFSPAKLQQTGNPLDVALTERGQFFAVEVQNPRTGAVENQLTRDGRFTRNGHSELVTATGHRVLDVNDQPIVVPGEAMVEIDTEGRVLQAGGEIARIQVAQVDDTDQLVKRGGNRFVFKDADARQLAANPALQSGFIEASGVDPIKALMQMIAATKAVSGNGEMIRYHDMLMDKAVNTLGRVA